jgi:hypothetical protein
MLYFAWAALEVGRMLAGRRQMLAPGHFARIWSKHILRALPPP